MKSKIILELLMNMYIKEKRRKHTERKEKEEKHIRLRLFFNIIVILTHREKHI